MTPHPFIDSHPLAALAVLAVAFLVLSKCAGLFVDAAVALAWKLGLSKLVIGIVLVAMATTTPELSVSLLSAIRGQAEIALGNAIGSVICDDGLALGLAGVVSAVPIAVSRDVLRSSGLFLVIVSILSFVFVGHDLTLSRAEGAILLALFAVYMFRLVRSQKGKPLDDLEVAEGIEQAKHRRLGALAGMFVLALAGIIVASEFVVASATSLARAAGIPESVVALTLVALGTSIPEVATCITAARKGHGELAVGNILGADILNICWIAGASALANDLTLGRREVFFMFPAMFVVVGLMLVMLRVGHRLTRAKGAVLLLAYVIYLVSFAFVFPPRMN